LKVQGPKQGKDEVFEGGGEDPIFDVGATAGGLKRGALEG